MDIETIVSTEYESFDADARAATLRGTFDDPRVEGVLVERDGDYLGILTRRQLASSRVDPDQKLASLCRPAPRVAPDADIREVAELMIDGDTRLLPSSAGNASWGS